MAWPTARCIASPSASVTGPLLPSARVRGIGKAGNIPAVQDRGDQFAVVHLQISVAAIVGINVDRIPPLSTDGTTNRRLIALFAGHAP
jgi:hypothetical protein